MNDTWQVQNLKAPNKPRLNHFFSSLNHTFLFLSATLPWKKIKLVDGSLVCDGVVDLGVRKLEVVDLGRWCEDADCGFDSWLWLIGLAGGCRYSCSVGLCLDRLDCLFDGSLVELGEWVCWQRGQLTKVHGGGGYFGKLGFEWWFAGSWDLSKSVGIRVGFPWKGELEKSATKLEGSLNEKKMESAIVEHLIDYSLSVLATEASLLWGVRDAVDSIKDELESMRSFLVDADKKGVGSEGEKTWVANVRDMAYDVEDVIDQFIYHINSQRIGGRFVWFLHHTIYIPQTVWGTSSKDNQKWVVRHGESSLFLKEDELVGIENKRQILMGWLMDGEPIVISIVGMGGSGKTTLVANTYNNDDVKKHFDCCAWITVSQAYDIEDLLRSMIKEFHESRKEANPSRVEFHELQTVILRDSYPGSKIILTTRNEVVASHPFVGEPHVYHIEKLEKGEAWELFCKKAFSTGSCPQDLTLLAQELVGKCEGLPLALAALGSLMYAKNISQWKEIYNSLNWSLSNNPKLQAVKTILLLSFNDLPYRLKHCFLYCSLFPEDHTIRRRRIIMLWMAEGFVEQVKGSTQEEVADSYLVQLTFRNMLQVVKRNASGRPKKCKMHDLMRELALSISEKEKFGVVHDGGEEMKECKAHRISIHKTDRELKSFTGKSKIRSLLVFNKSLKTLPSRSKMLRVLDLEDVPIDELPDKLFKLFNLRYLSLRGTLVKELPKSIGRLLNLQTLDIKDTQIKALPHGIGKLQNLRHLITYGYTGNWNDFEFITGMQAPSNICRFEA
uniref:NB-ARC domain-containing protein n=1 Tax=Fagus sylvatica TaxID=28930 RepID=A0A2N9H0A3_FAGSY